MEKCLALASPRQGSSVQAATALRPLNRCLNQRWPHQFPAALDTRRSLARASNVVGDLAGASLLFVSGERPDVDQLRALAAADPSIRVSFDPEEGPAPRASAPTQRWVELLADGFTFDLGGLAPGDPQPVPLGTHRFGLPRDFNAAEFEAISLLPGLQIAPGGRMVPVLRSLAQLAAALAGLPGVVAVGWHAAGAWSEPQHFRGSVTRWVQGGAFPGLGLTALAPTDRGGFQSEGLALFTGQELRLAPELAPDRATGARLALRLLHWLVEHGYLERPVRLTAPSGAPLRLEPSSNRRVVEVFGG